MHKFTPPLLSILISSIFFLSSCAMHPNNIKAKPVNKYNPPKDCIVLEQNIKSIQNDLDNLYPAQEAKANTDIIFALIGTFLIFGIPIYSYLIVTENDPTNIAEVKGKYNKTVQTMNTMECSSASRYTEFPLYFLNTNSLNKR